MTQIVLVIIFIVAALGYLGYFIYRKYFRKNDQCESCSLGKEAMKEK